MNGRALAACTRKESLLLARDLQTVALLFIMPAVFILIMSLALQDRFSAAGGESAHTLVANEDNSSAARELIDGIAAAEAFRVQQVAASEAASQRIRAGQGDFAVAIEAGFGRALANKGADPSQYLRVLAAPDVDPLRAKLLAGVIRRQLGQLQLAELARQLPPLVDFDPRSLEGELSVNYLYGNEQEQRPSSVQQNVPAWLVFGIFFIVIPLSNTMIRERNSRMEQRLRTMPAGQSAVLLGKLTPYLVLNVAQTAVMLAVGLYAVPALGGEALRLDGVSITALTTMAVAVSTAALGYALLVASIARTTEQAGMLGGGGNIVLAAIGGIMVPEFVMPASLQVLTDISPMAWGLDGFLATFLDHNTWRAVTPRAAALVGFGVAGVTIAAWLQGRRST